VAYIIAIESLQRNKLRRIMITALWKFKVEASKYQKTPILLHLAIIITISMRVQSIQWSNRWKMILFLRALLKKMGINWLRLLHLESRRQRYTFIYLGYGEEYGDQWLQQHSRKNYTEHWTERIDSVER